MHMQLRERRHSNEVAEAHLREDYEEEQHETHKPHLSLVLGHLGRLHYVLRMLRIHRLDLADSGAYSCVACGNDRWLHIWLLATH